MARKPVVVKIVYNRLPELQERLREQAGAIIRKAAFDVEAHAKAIVPVDTGNLKNSIRSKMETDLSAIVGTHVEYAPYVEYGTYKMSARPYLGPAAEAVRPGLVAAMRELLND